MDFLLPFPQTNNTGAYVTFPGLCRKDYKFLSPLLKCNSTARTTWETDSLCDYLLQSDDIHCPKEKKPN